MQVQERGRDATGGRRKAVIAVSGSRARPSLRLVLSTFSHFYTQVARIRSELINLHRGPVPDYEIKFVDVHKPRFEVVVLVYGCRSRESYGHASITDSHGVAAVTNICHSTRHASRRASIL